jgi:hypothetical protein
MCDRAFGQSSGAQEACAWRVVYGFDGQDSVGAKEMLCMSSLIQGTLGNGSGALWLVQ